MANYTAFISLIRNNKLLRAGGAYTLINFGTALIPLLMVPILTRLLPPSEMGHWAMFSATLAMLVPVLSLGLSESIGRHFFGNTQQQNATHIGSVLIFTSALCITLSAITIYASPYLEPLIHLPSFWINLLPLMAFMQTQANILFMVCICLQRPSFYGVWRFGQTITLYSMAVALLFAGGTSWQILGSAQAVTAGVVLVCGLLWMKSQKLLSFQLNTPQLKNSLRFGLPLVAQNLAMVLMLFSDRFILSQFVSLSEVGFYMVGYQMAQGMLLVATSCQQAWAPWFYKRIHNPPPQGMPWSTVLLGAMGILLGVTAIYMLVVPLAMTWFLPATYAISAPVTAILALGFGIYGMMALASVIQMQARRTHIIAIIMVITGALNIGLNYMLIPHYGLKGAAIASVLGYMVGLGLTLADVFYIARTKTLSPHN